MIPISSLWGIAGLGVLVVGEYFYNRCRSQDVEEGLTQQLVSKTRVTRSRSRRPLIRS